MKKSALRTCVYIRLFPVFTFDVFEYMQNVTARTKTKETFLTCTKSSFLNRARTHIFTISENQKISIHAHNIKGIQHFSLYKKIYLHNVAAAAAAGAAVDLTINDCVVKKTHRTFSLDKNTKVNCKFTLENARFYFSQHFFFFCFVCSLYKSRKIQKKSSALWYIMFLCR